jgi:hypothetical protein
MVKPEGHNGRVNKWVDFNRNEAQFYFKKWIYSDFRPNISVFQ